MRPGPIWVVHFVPIAGMAGRKNVDIRDCYNNPSHFGSQKWGNCSRTLNLDGLIVHPGSGNKSTEMDAFNQIFRSGAMEAVRHGGSFEYSQQRIPSEAVAEFFREYINRSILVAQSLGFAGPAVISAALLSVGDCQFCYKDSNGDNNRAVADRQHLMLPDVWVENIDSPGDVESFIHPVLDVLWQSLGIEQCLLYDKNGTWRAAPNNGIV